MKLFGARVLQDLGQGSWEEAEVVGLELGYGGVGAEVEAGKQGREGQRFEDELLMIVGGKDGYDQA